MMQVGAFLTTYSNWFVNNDLDNLLITSKKGEKFQCQ